MVRPAADVRKLHKARYLGPPESFHGLQRSAGGMESPRDSALLDGIAVRNRGQLVTGKAGRTAASRQPRRRCTGCRSTTCPELPDGVIVTSITAD